FAHAGCDRAGGYDEDVHAGAAFPKFGNLIAKPVNHGPVESFRPRHNGAAHLDENTPAPAEYFCSLLSVVHKLHRFPDWMSENFKPFKRQIPKLFIIFPKPAFYNEFKEMKSRKLKRTSKS